jgi:diguanylate cyclase (GGDEF)-like protein
MAAMLEPENAIEAQALSTSLDPYGQLLKMLMPRALCIAIYDRMGMPLWLSDGCEEPDLLQFIEEALNSARSGDPDPTERHGFARTWNGDAAYIFILREGVDLLGVVALSCRDSGGGARPFSMLQGLLRPALQVLTREFVSQYSIGDLQKSLTLRDADLELLLEATGGADQIHNNDFEQLVRTCVERMECAFGALLLPERSITVAYSSDGAKQRGDVEVLERVQRHLFAWAQVQRRTLTLNKAPASSPFGAVSYKILACPIRHGDQHVAGMLVLFRPISGSDFNVRQVRIVEMMTRKVSYLLHNAYDASGLLTRPAFEQRVLVALGDRVVTAQHCVAYADIDGLHAVNENYGMHVGDAVLAQLAHCIRTSLPATVAASRISGDRFAVFFPTTPLDSASEVLELLCKQVAAIDCIHDGKRVETSISVGVAAVPDTKYPLSHGLAAAEVACKTAKERGRSRVEIHHGAARSVSKRHDDAAIANTLREAIANDRFRMEAQPIVQFGVAGLPRRYELLLRMIDATGQSVAPGKFFAAAERHLLATDIDRWVVQYALEILSSAAPTLQSIGAHFTINLSGQSLGDESFPAYLEAKLHEYSLPPSLLSFEINETAAVANIVRAEMLIRRLQDLGHDIALDDFGRGLSSLDYLKSLSVAGLKIDGGLVRDLAGNPHSQAMVTAIVQLAGTMKLSTTAECVESEAILAAVGQLGVDFGQGFAIGRPRPLEGVMQELLRTVSGVSRPSASRLVSRFAG